MDSDKWNGLVPQCFVSHSFESKGPLKIPKEELLWYGKPWSIAQNSFKNLTNFLYSDADPIQDDMNNYSSENLFDSSPNESIGNKLCALFKPKW